LVVGDGYPWTANPHPAFPYAHGIPSGYGKVTYPFGNQKKGNGRNRYETCKIQN
jgi:hypothetical protein